MARAQSMAAFVSCRRPRLPLSYRKPEEKIMPSLSELKAKMRLPVIGAPMFIVSTPKLVIA